MFEGRTDMGDDLEALLAADEAAISDDGFSSHVARNARSRSTLRRGWLAVAGAIGLGVSLFSLSTLWKPVTAAIDTLAPGQLVLSLPVVDLSLQMRGESMLAVAFGLMVLLAVAATRFVGDEF